ncbi:thiol-disulfide oxidoreductase ResA [Bacillaceae bacterium Marseille-Q3522]|nr:thiol-disulfide oxidoreductase ResA [Bacillaceae bacterium Marseille-Q3522]
MIKKKRFYLRTAVLFVLGTAVLYTMYANFTKGEMKKVTVGEKAPDFVLTDMNGEKHQLSDYRGKGVLLNFWGTWCKPCEKEMPYMENLYQQFEKEGVHTLAVNVGESDFAVSKFIERHGLTFPIVIDRGGQVQTAYRINPLPITFLINKEGVVVKAHTGALTEEMLQMFMKEIKP